MNPIVLLLQPLPTEDGDLRMTRVRECMDVWFRWHRPPPRFQHVDLGVAIYSPLERRVPYWWSSPDKPSHPTVTNATSARSCMPTKQATESRCNHASRARAQAWSAQDDAQ